MMTNTIPSSPEFEFCSAIRSHPAPRIVSADELFSGGILLPLDRLSLRSSVDDPPDHDYPPVGSVQQQQQDSANSLIGPKLAHSAEPTSSSKRWRDIFKKIPPPDHHQVEEFCNRGKEKEMTKEKRKTKRSRGGSPELININIWPFSRSRSAGTDMNRPGIPLGPPPARIVSSAPCSRSNSAGESKSRTPNNGHRWPSSPASPGRARLHVGRNSPIWQPRRVGSSASGSRIPTTGEPAVLALRKGGGQTCNNEKDSNVTKAPVLNVNISTCIGSRANVVCRREAGRRAPGRAIGAKGNLFSLRGLFSKKVH